MAKLDLETMVGDVKSNKITLTICGLSQFGAATILNFFQKGQPMILGQNFKFLLSLRMAKLDLEMMW